MDKEEFKKELIKIKTLPECECNYHFNFNETGVINIDHVGWTKLIPWEDVCPSDWEMFEDYYEDAMKERKQFKKLTKWVKTFKPELIKLGTLPSVFHYHKKEFKNDGIIYTSHGGWTKTLKWNKLTLANLIVLKNHYEKYMEGKTK